MDEFTRELLSAMLGDDSRYSERDVQAVVALAPLCNAMARMHWDRLDADERMALSQIARAGAVLTDGARFGSDALDKLRGS